ncbi:glycosyltransferase family 2 protein [Virgibacillus doumboii]|uniref:glycosyltransferase family 2 protein n=1 Tax=Virgibacillus doumboii TaxID=2697503 RepID=UPI0013DF7079|nr:glycosyltransferase family A protein [Virgibacillus doumboii]
MNSLINRLNSTIMSEKKFANKVKYNKNGYYIHNKSKNTSFIVTVIIPVYNAEKTMSKTVDSIIKQTIGFENIELLLIDDKSEDNSRTLSLKYSKKHNNIIPVFLKKNTGSPSKPRNLGIDLAKGKYIMFLDSDDWLHENGIKVLYDLLEKSNNNYAIGKSIKLTDKGQSIVGEYNNWADRESVNPIEIDRLFYHMSPTGRMVKTDFLRNKNIKFPDMKFAEDKQFFFDVLINCDFISTSKDVIYYINRFKDNASFTTTTSIFEKTDTNISLINYVIDKDLPVKIEKMMLNRLYEFDCITRLFDRGHFLKSQEKEKYYKKFKEVLATTDKLKYNIKDIFWEEWHKVLVDLFLEERYEDIVKLINWNRYEPIKDYCIKDNLPYYRLPFDDKYSLARINTLAVHQTSVKKDDKLTINFRMYGDNLNKVENLVARKRNNDLIQIEFSINHLEENLFEVDIPYHQLENLSDFSYAIFIKYDHYKKVPIKMNSRNIVKYKRKNIDFYTTIADNLGINIK